MDFFTNYPSDRVVPMFGAVHIIIILLTVAAIVLLYSFRNRFGKFKDKIPFITAGILFANMAVYYGGYAINGVYDYKNHLPLHLCFITGYIFMFIIFFKKSGMFEYLFYCVCMCTIISIIWMPPMGYDRYVFYQFLISHNLMLVLAFYMLFVLKYKITKKGIYKSVILNNVIFSLVLIFNRIFDTNYIFSKSLPDHVVETYPFLKDINLFATVLLLEVSGILIAALIYILMKKLKFTEKASTGGTGK